MKTYYVKNCVFFSCHWRSYACQRENVTKYCTSSCWSEHILVTPAEKVRVPVTVITGQLGSGKTTLLNYVLTEQVVNQS